jgi:hypothetical protein
MIEYAGYGVYNRTINVTAGIRDEYGSGKRVFLADNRFGDPAPGEKKYLYILWSVGSEKVSGVTGEGSQGIIVP